MESNLSNQYSILISPGILWNADVSLLAIIYLAIGFYCKKTINRMLLEDNLKIDIAVMLISLIIIAFCIFNYWGGRRFYYFDMKYIYYKELISAIIIPSAFGLILLRVVYWIERINKLSYLEDVLAFLGQMTIPIMFMHMPLNALQSLIGYGRIVYFFIGICVPVIITVLFNKFAIMRKFFGLPLIKKY
jgi:hypothetical protein